MSKSVRYSSEMTNTVRWPIYHTDKSICGKETTSALSVMHTSGFWNTWKNYSAVNMSKSACGCPVSSLASWNEAAAHCHLLRMQTTINSWSLGTLSTVASCTDFSRDICGDEDASTEGSPKERERERTPALSAECLLVGEEQSDPCPYPSRIQHPLHLVSFFTLPHTGSICQ